MATYGMPNWFVSEPTVNLFAKDTPLWYRPSRGNDIRFELFYKNTLGSNGVVDASQYLIFGVGTNWNTPWRSYLLASGSDFYVFSGSGSISYSILNAVDFESSGRLTTGADADTYYITYSDGTRHVYGPKVTLAGTFLWFLTRIDDARGNASATLQYTVTNNTIRLNKVIDADSQETTFVYTNNAFYSNLIVQVNAPYGLTVNLKYDSQARLTNITDVVQLSSSFKYDSSNRMSSLITPYGTNSFDYYSGTGWSAVRVTELGLRQHLYLQGDGPSGMFSTASADLTSLSNYLWTASIASTFTGADLNKWNSYYWGPRQYANLTSTVRTKLDNATFALSDVLTNDYNKGVTRHWLARLSDPAYVPVSVGNAVALEREPSPNDDGSTEGQLTWYDHMGKSHDIRGEGYTKFPNITAKKLSDGEWQILYQEREWNSNVTLQKENYGPHGSVAWHQIQNTYDANLIDLITSVDGSTTVVSNSFNSKHQVTASHNALGEATLYTYDDSGASTYLLTSITRPTGWITTNSYDGNGRLSTVIDRDTSTTYRTNSYTYTNGLMWTHTDERGLKLTFERDKLGRLTKTTYPDSTTIINTYDKLDVVKTTDRMGFTNSYGFNGFSQILRQTNAISAVTSYYYCDCGALNAMTNAEGQVTSYSYDNQGRRTRTTYPDGSYLDSVFDVYGRLSRTVDNLGVSTTNFYTVNGMTFTASNAFGRVFLRKYDDRNRIVSSTDINGVTLGMGYDDLSRLLIRTNSSVYDAGTDEIYAVAEHYAYANNLRSPVAVYREDITVALWGAPDGSIADYFPFGPVVTYEYDLFDRKTNEVHGTTSGTSVQTNSYVYNGSGDLRSLRDGKAQTTTWKYDEYGRVTNKLDAASTLIFIYGYDANGRLSSRWTPEKGYTYYSYDAVGNLTSVNYPSSPDLTLAYDKVNRLTNMLDAVGTTSYRYTSFGALQSEDGPWADDAVSYSYTANRLRSGLSLSQPGAAAWSQTYAYDAANRLSTVASGAGSFGYQYSAVGSESSPAQLVKKLTLPNGSAITNEFDEQARWLGTTLRTSGGTLLNQHLYDYNDLDQRTQQTRTDGSYVDYGYDALGQLVDATGKESGGGTNRVHERFGYYYDAAGNLNRRTNNALVQTFTVNNLNQLSNATRSGNMTVAGATTIAASSVTVNTLTAERYADKTFARTNVTLVNGNNTFTAVATDSSGRGDTNAVTINLPSTVSFVYDLNGNLRTNGTRILEYDDENQLTRVTEPSTWKSEFTYDSKLRMRISRDYTWRNGTWVLTNEVRRVYDGMLVIQERDQLNVPKLTYSRGKDISGSLEGAGGIGGLLALTSSIENPSSSYYFHSDGNGNVTALVDTNQNLVARYLFDPFGNSLSATGPKAELNRYRFSSKENQAASGLVYYGYRFYDPNLQRWPNRDPLGEEAGANLFKFCDNTPITLLDPLGEAAYGAPAVVDTNPPWGGNTTSSGGRSLGGIVGGTGPSAHGVPRGCVIGEIQNRQPNGETATKDCPCSGPAITVTCYKYQQCVAAGLAGGYQSGISLAGKWEWKTECPCPEGKY